MSFDLGSGASESGGNMGSRKPKERLFFEAPDHVQTPAKIVAEARNSLRSIQTRRPETPQDGQRKLFGDQSVRDPTNRPPSAFSLGSGNFNESESRPVSGTRLTPLDHKPRSLSIDAEAAIAPKPPADPNRPLRRPGSRQRLYQQSVSVDAGQGESLARGKSGSLTDVSEDAPMHSPTAPAAAEVDRRVHSGPKERTRHSGRATPAEDLRGEGDSTVTEASSRTDARGSRRKGKNTERRSAEGERVESGYSSDVTREGSAGSQRERASSAGKPGSAGKREEETPEEAHYYNTNIGPIVDEMATHIKEKDHSRLAELSGQLYTALEEGRLLGKACKRRPLILKTVFKLLDLESPKLLLKLARLIFALKVSGNNLVNVCKLVFKVSRDEKNDVYFLEGNILEYLIETARTSDHQASGDALVYCVGALKFLSGNNTVVKHLVKRRTIEALNRLLTAINKTTAESGKAQEQLGHILVQLTATLRNLADVKDTRQQFLSLHLVDELCKIMETYSHDGDLMLNVCRIFSKLTLHTDCCMAVASHSSHFRSFIHLLQKYQKREDLVVRISFILGNLTAKNDRARRKLVDQPKCLETLISVFKHYFEQDLKTKEEKKDADSTSAKPPPNKTEDVLIKVIRVLANLSINEDIGPSIASNDTCVNLLVQILDHKKLETSEELVLNSIATINNLSYYNIKSSAITRTHISIAESLMVFLEAHNKEGLAEATRVYGNLSREKSVRDFLVKHKVDEAMVAMLDSGNREVVFTACGVLINLMADDDKRKTLKKQGGIRKLVDVLRDLGPSDWQLASMVCQTLWNYSSKITSTNASFGEHEAAELQDLLIEYLDDEVALENPEFDEAMRDYIQEVWENEFRPVASKLLDRLESHQSNFEPLEHPS